MPRTFNSLRQALRAFDLISTWTPQRFTGAMRDRLDRTRRAADYLLRRVLRAERKAA
jgi:hypothetical protein